MIIQTRGRMMNIKEKQYLELIDELEVENAKLKECVEYYANETTDIIAVRARKVLEDLK